MKEGDKDMNRSDSADVSLKSRPSRADDLVWREIEGEIVILTEDGRNIHTLNNVGSVIWNLADGVRSISEIAVLVCDRFEAQGDAAETDTLEFCREMVEKKIFRV